ncbi:autotransporter outer membrane beta-barrel domain-containing protein [Fibrobacter sp.]|uniref:autotransporter outer membrane beta-barrel domain-containing protein n=1 Tax=Fibrobacter sp. TaxID=35828 RepID=UPI0038670FA2
MFKKVLLTLCLSAFLSWAQDDFDEDDEGFISAPAAAQEGDEGGSHAKIATDEDEEEEVYDVGMNSAQRREMAERKKFEEEQRLDEYANSERRRDWLRNRLIFQIGMGSRYPIMGETGMGMGLGAGVEYILPFHLALYGSFGFLPKGTDNDFDEWELEGGTGYKVGLNYYLFPKNPLHLGVSVSYGTVYFDHDIKPDDSGVRALIKVDGIQVDALITYLTNEWYYLQFSIGMYYAPKLAKIPQTHEAETDNPSFRKRELDDGAGGKIWLNEEWVTRVVEKDGMNKTGIVFGIAIGYALPELFPDDTEKRRREREKARARSGVAGR